MSGALDQSLARFNARWQDRYRQFRRHAPPPWWAPGVIVTADMRYHYESYLPASEFCNDLVGLALHVLPGPGWVPRMLRPPVSCCGGHGGTPHLHPASVADLWAALPPQFGGRITFAAEELFPLFCACADPGRFGTAPERYPEQQEALRQWTVRPADTPPAALDLGCGVGLGTWELAELLTQCGVQRGPVVGVTHEPLEAWMATRRVLPHDPRRSARFGQSTAAVTVCFLAGDVMATPLKARFGVIVCNGLVGGEFLCRPRQYEALLAEVQRLLAPRGLLLVANRFHDGREPMLKAFADSATARGWEAAGHWRTLVLSRGG